MTGIKVNKCCQEYSTMVKKIRKTAKVNAGTIYLDQQERQVLVNWIENNKVEISKCPNCGALVKSWIKNNYTIPESAFPKEENP